MSNHKDEWNIIAAENLRSVMKDKGMELKELSEKCNVYPMDISLILDGWTEPKVYLAIKIAHALGVKLDDIWHLTERGTKYERSTVGR